MKSLTSLLLLTLVLTACGREQTPAKPETEAMADPAASMAVVKEKCASCHGLDGRGASHHIPHLTGQKEEYLRVALDEYKTGARQHAALQQLFSELSDVEVRNIAAHYAAQARAVPTGKDVPAAAPDALVAGKAAAEACADCHGADGNSPGKGMPSLAGQHPGYLVAAVQAYNAGGTRKEPSKAALMSGLDPAAMKNIAVYYAEQAPKGHGKPKAGNPAKGEPLSASCGSCHGLKGHSFNARTPSLAGQDAQYLVKAMQAYRDGSRNHKEMQKGLADLGDKELEHIAAFYTAQTPTQPQTQAPATIADTLSRCERCHGPQAENPSMVVPYLEGQQAVYMADALKAYRDGKRVQSAMHAMGSPLSDADIQAIAEYYAGLLPR